MKTISIVNGPNLNLLGKREPEHYGNKSLDMINNELKNFFADRVSLQFYQSNHEGDLIDYLQNLSDVIGVVINPGAFTHTSIAMRDTLLARKFFLVEVHLSNIYRREDFRKTSYFSDIALGVISGLGPCGYRFAIEALLTNAHKGNA